LLDDDSIKCWAQNSLGQLGMFTGDKFSRGKSPEEMGDNLPAVALGTGRHATAVVTGWFHTCALLDDGTVKCWGGNSAGELNSHPGEVRHHTSPIAANGRIIVGADGHLGSWSIHEHATSSGPPSDIRDSAQRLLNRRA